MSPFKALRVESENFQRLDVLRFIAACGIVVFHYRDLLGLPPLVKNAVSSFPLFVDLFFVISGVVISHVYGDRISNGVEYGRFIWARIARLGPLHWATLAFYVAEGIVAARIGVKLKHANDYDWQCFIPNLTLTHAWGLCNGLSFNSVSWSISAEFFLYLSAPIIFLLTYSKPVVSVIAALAMLIAFNIYSMLHPANVPWWDWTYHYGMIRAIPAFLFGCGIYAARSGLSRLPYSSILTWTVLILFFVLLLFGITGGWLLLLVYFIPTAALAADTRGPPNRLTAKIAPLGQLTYSIYMLHPVVQTVMMTILGDKMLHLSGASAVGWAVFCTAAVLPLSYVSLMLYEGPARRLLNGRRKRREPLPEAT